MLQWYVETNIWWQPVESTCMQVLTKQMLQSCHFEFDWKQMRCLCEKKQPCIRRTCYDQVFDIDCSLNINETSKLLVNYQPSDHWFCYDTNIFRFDARFQRCFIYA